MVPPSSCPTTDVPNTPQTSCYSLPQTPTQGWAPRLHLCPMASAANVPNATHMWTWPGTLPQMLCILEGFYESCLFLFLMGSSLNVTYRPVAKDAGKRSSQKI